MSANPIFKIGIHRKVKDEKCTQGYLSVNGEIIGYCLELPDKDNAKNVSSIPRGVYSAFIRTDGKRGWRLELINVPNNRTNIQIHAGNRPKEIQGCILVGETVSIKDSSVSYSRKKMRELEKRFNDFTTDLVLNQNSSKPIEIQIEIDGV